MIRQLFLDFASTWPSDKLEAIRILQENKVENQFVKKTGEGKKKTFALYGLQSANILDVQIPANLHATAGIPPSKYKIEGSVGQGNPVEVPWVGLFDLEITSSAQKGYYVVYLFKSDMTGVYLSLNQGWTRYKNEFGIKEGRKEILKNADLAKHLLRGDQGFSYDKINLEVKGSLGKGYELGNICSMYYSLDNLPTEGQLVDDLRNLIGVYRELKGLVGTDIVNIKDRLDEDTFQQESQVAIRKHLGAGPVSKKQKQKVSSSEVWSRDPSIASDALFQARYTCEYDQTHFTFISEVTGKQFVEAHHLIPMKHQDSFQFNLDVPENIISLCPNCHRAFHSASFELREKMIIKFYDQRIEKLQSRGVSIDKSTLLKYYKNEAEGVR